MWHRILIVVASLVASGHGICPELCTCDDVNLIVTCIKAGLDVMPNTLNPGLRTIIYKYNEFPTIHFSLTFLPALEKVDLSHNKIVTISSRAFQNQNQLKLLKLENNKISQVTNQTFYGLSSLKVLVLRGNLIEKLPQNLFGHSIHLEEIDLGRNRIGSIDSTAFQGLHGLQILNLEDNELKSIPSEALKQIPDLAEFYLAGNPIKTISDRAFVNFQRLTTLDLSSSRLRLLERSALRGLGTLRTLKLADNNLSSIPSDSFQHVPNLESLDIGRNPFQVIPNRALRFLTKLKHLEASGCGRLASIEAGAFMHCVDLEKVTISLNRRLNRISLGAFDVMPNLKFLDLTDNSLQRLPKDLLNWQSLRSLHLAGNPWSCDCHLAFMAPVLRKLKQKELEAIASPANQDAPQPSGLITEGVCVSPQSLKHKRLSQMPDEAKLDCDLSESSNEVSGGLQQPRESVSNSNSAVRKSGGGFRNSNSRNSSSVFTPTVIICIVLSVLVVFLVAVILLVYRYRYPLQNWAKAIRWHQHDQAIARKGTLQDPYLRQHEYRQPSYSCDDEHYYYVATMQNRLAAGKHIPVTEL